MSRIRGRDTAPELAVRRFLHRQGFRYRLHAPELPGRPDIVFRPTRKAIFVHGCYWHGHGCARGGTGAKSNREYWGPKIEKNRSRDAANVQKLAELGWEVLVIWECEASRPELLAAQLGAFLDKRLSDGGIPSMQNKPPDYSISRIDAFIASVHAQESDEAFQASSLLELEKLVRSHDKTKELPGKTLLRERLNAFRSQRWPELAPKKGSRRRYW